VSVDLDGEATVTQLVEGVSRPQVKRPTRHAKVLGIGPDGRKCYTVDADARAGHRSATNSRQAGPYVGYELHLAVQARDVRWTNNIDRTTSGPEVPGVITTCNLVPAGSHRGRAVVDGLIAAKRGGHQIEDVVWDPGYSLCKEGTTAHPLAQAGIRQTFQVVTHQRGSRPFSKDALLLDGQLYSAHLPEALRNLTSPPRGASEAEKLTYEAKFNQRARWRLVRHAGPDPDGVTRWRCPFCAGLLRSRRFPRTMRISRQAPLVEVGDGVTACCSGILSVVPAELGLHQRIPFGTTAWRISMGRRQVVESVNAALKGAFVDLARGFFRVFGQVKMTVLLGFTVAAYNLDRVRSFRAKQEGRAKEAVFGPPEGRVEMTTSHKKKGAESTLLVLIIDRSGSMESIREDMEGGIKTLPSEQAEEPGSCVVTLAQFDNVYELVADEVPVAELTTYRLVPRGSTALLDALGRTISYVRARVEALGPAERPGHIVVAVITDGLENASTEWSHLQVMDSVKARIDEGWHFTFLGANQDAIQEGRSMGVAAASSLNYAATSDGTREAMSSTSASMRRMRRGEAKSLEYTEEERRRSAG
jgi:Mg-chelatase subunit ChlD